jgi:hypothetical protein
MRVENQFVLRNRSSASTREENVFKYLGAASIRELASVNIRVLIEPAVQPVA